MNETPVERVKRVISVLNPECAGAFCVYTDPEQCLCGQIARAAIAALREPTEAMIVDGDEQAIEVLNDHTFALKEPTLARRVWQKMLDAILNERAER
jgi:hypothetical protein